MLLLHGAGALAVGPKLTIVKCIMEHSGEVQRLGRVFEKKEVNNISCIMVFVCRWSKEDEVCGIDVVMRMRCCI